MFSYSTSDSALASALQPAAGAPDDRATDFKAVEGDTGEHFNGYTLMVEAYAAIWLIMMAWMVFLWRKQADLTSRVEGLEGAITRAEKRAAGAKAKPSEKAAAAKASPSPSEDAKTESA